MFHPSRRLSIEEVYRQSRELVTSEYFSRLLTNVPDVLLVVNACRQIIFVNKQPGEAWQIEELQDVLGKRPGELLQCVHAEENKDGCGATRYCDVCGFANAVKSSENDKSCENECNLIVKNGAGITLNVFTRPFTFRKEKFVFCVAKNISKEKYKTGLEKIFIHDVRNTLSSFFSLLRLFDTMDKGAIHELMEKQVERMYDEVESYQLMLSAENEDLNVRPEQVDLPLLLKDIVSLMKVTPGQEEKHIILDVAQQQIRTDKTILRRVIINLIKNALEATRNGGEVIVNGKKTKSGHITIEVINNAVIEESVGLQLFYKFFSTKGAGRGVGLYSVKLLTENYLRGSIEFVSTVRTGTRFMLTIPELGNT